MLDEKLPLRLWAQAMKLRGNCYVTSEALFHLLGGKLAGWKAMRMKWEGDTHWFIMNVNTGHILDATAAQFKRRPDYSKATGTGFLTKKPSKRAVSMMNHMLWTLKRREY